MNIKKQKNTDRYSLSSNANFSPTKPGLRVLLLISQELFYIHFICVYSATPTSICTPFHQKLFFLCFMINTKNVEQTETDGMEIKGGSESGW